MPATQLKFLRLALAASALILLSSCGSDEDETLEPEACFETTLANCGAGPWDPFGIALAFAWWGGLCTEEVACTASPVETDIEAGMVTGDFIAANWTTNNANESEPNDGADQATPFIIQNDGAFLISGVVNDTSDPADFLIFTTESGDLHAIYLCRTVNECTLPFLQSDEIYIDLLDQDGTLIRTTQNMQTQNGHEIVFSPSPGLRYYAVVRALDTSGGDFAYKLVITD